MKNLKLLITTLLLLCSIVVSAHDFKVNGIYYNITDATNKTVEVTYRGDYYNSYTNEYTGSVVIPKSVTYGGTTYSVTSIGSSAFDDCSGLTSIEIPNSVTSIGNYAFSDCSGLTSVTIPNSVTSIVGIAFENCSGLTSIEIPNSVTSIGERAFRGCSGLTNITVADGNTVYDSRDNCNAIIETATKTLIAGFKSTIIPNSVTSIGRSAFEDCSGLTSIEIPNSVTSIGGSAFYGCSGLTSVTIGNSVTSIEGYAFSDCSGLTSIEIPNSVTSIGDYAFSGCPGLTSITVASGNAVYDSRDNSNAIVETATNTLIVGCKNTVIPNSVTSIGSNAFYGCSGLTSIEIPNSVTSIGSSAFSGCSGLTSIEIPNSVTSIGSSAFSGCSDLTSITIPNSVTSIGSRAFYNCSGLTSVTIPNSVTSIGDYAFSFCSNLKTVINFSNLTFSKGSWDYGYVSYYADKVINAPNGSIEGDFVFSVIDDVNTLQFYLGDDTEITLPNSYKGENYVIGEDVFANKTSITSIEIPNNVTSIGESAFSGCSGLTSIEIPNSVTSIGIDAFYGCSALTNIEIPNSVTSIGDRVFYNCSGLTSVTIPNSVTSIGSSAFYNCSGLTSIEIPNSVTSIGSSAFYNCFGLINIEIPNSVTSIGDRVFYNCSGLTSIEIPNSVTNIGYNAFYGCDGLKTVMNYSNLTFSKGSSNYGYVAYYADKVINAPNGFIEGDFVWFENENGMTLAGYLGNATELTLPAECNNKSVTSIGDKAFYNCSGLTSITIGNSVTSIGNGAFSGCSGLESITIPDSVTSIGSSAFSGCSAIKKLELDCETIASWFKGISSIKEIVLGNNVTSIGESAFQSCSGLTSVKISNSVTNIGESAFRNCSSLTSVEIPNSVTSIGGYAFYNCSGLTSIEIPNSVTSIGNYAFYGCNGLTSVTIGSSVTSIGEWMFYKCTGLTSVTIGNSVTSIGRSAFEDCSALISVEIPNSVTNIVQGAFYKCSSLTSVTIGNSVTSIGFEAFYGCSGLKTVINFSNLTFSKGSSGYGYVAYYANKVINAPNGSIEGDFVFSVIDGVNTLQLYLGDDTEITLPNNYKGESYVIGEDVFANKTSITSIEIPNNVTSIGSSAFSGCSALTSIEIPNSVTSIGNYAFSGCSGLTNIEIPNSVTSIGESAFSGCSGLTNVTIPNSITSIEEGTFYGCSGITSIEIPNSVTSIGGSAFYNCSGLTSIEIPNSVTSIGIYAFYGCSGLASIEIPNSVTHIGHYAFRDCSGITSITIPNSVTYIGDYVFGGWTSLKEVVFEDGDKELFLGYNWEKNQGLFYDCPLETLYLGRNINVINPSTGDGYPSFCDNKTLSSITIGSCVTNIVDNLFKGCTGLKNVINCSSLVMHKGSSKNGYVAYYATKIIINGYIAGDFMWGINDDENILVSYFGNDTEVVLPQSCNGENYVIATDVFKNNTSITSIEFPNTIIGVEENAFEGCTSLTAVYVNDINSWCNIEFANSSANPLSCAKKLFLMGNLVTDLVIPNEVKEIKSYAFYACNEIEKVYISNSIESIGDYAFAGCDNILEIRIAAKKAITANENIFSSDVYNNACLYVPEGRKFAYERTTPWNKFYIEEIENIAPVYTVTFMLDGNVYVTYTLEIGADIPFVDNPSKEGYTFSGWSNIPTTMPAQDVVIEGALTINSYAVIYKVDGEVVATDSISYGAEIPLIEEPTKEGYTFSGWSNIPTTMPAQDVVIEGALTINSYAVIYKVDGEVVATDSISYGAEIPLIEEPTKEGYTFSGWSNIPTTMPAQDVIVEGVLTINSYAVIYKVDGEVVATDSISYGAEIPLIEEPTKEGYTFSGWSNIPATMPAQDVVIEGTFVLDDTAVEDIEAEGANNKTIYDLQGRKIEKITSSGIYIIDGKQVFVK